MKQKWVPLEVETIKTEKKKNNRGGKQMNHNASASGDKKKSDDSKKNSGKQLNIQNAFMKIFVSFVSSYNQ